MVDPADPTKCKCIDGFKRQNPADPMSMCIPDCPPNKPFNPATRKCECPPGQHEDRTGNCIKCLAPKVWDDATKTCICPPDTHEMWKGQCVPKCPEGQVRNQETGECHNPPPNCNLATHEWWKGQCVPKCPEGQVRNQETGACECPPGYEWDEEQKLCVLPDYTNKITITSPVQFGGLLKGDINAKYKTEKVQKMGRNGSPIRDRATGQPGMENKESVDENGKKVVLYEWKGFAPFILGDILTVIDGSTSSVAFLIKKTNPIFAGEYTDHLGKVFRENAPRQDANTYIYTLKKGQNIIEAQGNTWKITPIRVKTLGCPELLATAARDAKLPYAEGFEKADPLIQIDFGYTESIAIRDKDDKPKIIVAPPVIIAAKSIRSYINHRNQEINIPLGTSAEKIANYVRAALLAGHSTPPSTPRAVQSGGAILRIHDHLDEVPYTFALQRLWEDKLKHYKSIEPEYQQMLPSPEQSPLEELQEPFHRYMDDFGDQDVLEEVRTTIGLMSPADAENLFHDDLPHINSMYEKAMPDVDERLIPIFIRADILRLLTK